MNHRYHSVRIETKSASWLVVQLFQALHPMHSPKHAIGLSRDTGCTDTRIMCLKTKCVEIVGVNYYIRCAESTTLHFFGGA